MHTGSAVAAHTYFKIIHVRIGYARAMCKKTMLI